MGILILFACSQSGLTQIDTLALRAMDEATSFGFGSYQLKDTYLSPFIYQGWGGRILNERVTWLQSKLSRQRIIGVDLATTKNPAENVNDFGIFVDYSHAYHYNVFNGNDFNILFGASASIMGGFIYNTRNGNNPLSAKADVSLSLSLMLMYTLWINEAPVTLRYQGMLPVAGLFFAPPYGASYYEMFNEGNLSDVLAFNSFHNKLGLTNYVTIDIPIYTQTLRLGYLYSYYTTDVHSIQTRIFSNTLLIGWVKEFYLK
jgi:hypothetical protein